MSCPSNEYYLGGRCLPCSQLCFKAKEQGTERLCRELCGGFQKTQAQDPSSVPHNNFLWIEILVPLMGVVIITTVLVVIYRKWRPQLPWQRRPSPTQVTSASNPGVLTTATGCNRPTQDTELKEIRPAGQIPTGDDPPVYSPTPSGRDTASSRPLLPENGSDRPPRDVYIV